MDTILFIIILAIVVAALCGKGPAEPPIYQIQLVPPEQPAGGRGHLITLVVLVVIILLIVAAG
jgi:hypothetical protein